MTQTCMQGYNRGVLSAQHCGRGFGYKSGKKGLIGKEKVAEEEGRPGPWPALSVVCAEGSAGGQQ